jgi:uncharacterized protein YndB with AHSA1/START domain
MSVNTRYVDATPAQVWSALADGWLYPTWVVGASRMRQVDDHWPAVGSRLHHSVGNWPLLIDDETEVTESVPEELLRLRAKARPAGEVEVVLRLRPLGAGTEIEMTEEPVAGPGRLLPAFVREPLLSWRNVESLRRLGFIAERRVAGTSEVTP